VKPINFTIVLFLQPQIFSKMVKSHLPATVYCEHCQHSVGRRYYNTGHKTSAAHKRNAEKAFKEATGFLPVNAAEEYRPKSVVVRPVKAGLELVHDSTFSRGLMDQFYLKLRDDHKDFEQVLQDVTHPLVEFLAQIVKQGGMRISLSLRIAMMQKRELKDDFYLGSNEKDMTTVINKGHIYPGVKKMLATIKQVMDTLIERGSDLSFSHAIALYIKVYEYLVHRGGSYVKFPDWFTKKRCGVNIKNEDEHCLDYCVASYFNPDFDNPEKARPYSHWIAENIKREDISYPVTEEDVEQYC